MKQQQAMLAALNKETDEAVANEDFETAAHLRDRKKELQNEMQLKREAWQQHQRHRQQQRRRAAIAAWQPRLLALAADLPAQAWLTRLEYQGVLLTLDGLALNLQALTSVEAALTRVAGFAPAKAGGTQRDAEGRWQFSFTLTGARADAD